MVLKSVLLNQRCLLFVHNEGMSFIMRFIAFRLEENHSNRLSPDVLEVTPGLDAGGWGCVRLSTKTCRLLSAKEVPRGRKVSNGRSPAPSRGIAPLVPSCRACGEGSACLTSDGRGNSLVGPTLLLGACLVRSSPLGAIVVAVPPDVDSWRTSGFDTSGLGALGLGGKDVLAYSIPAGLFGVDSCFSFPVPDLRGGGYVSPRASAAAFLLSVSALLGRPRFRGGSPLTRFSNEEKCVDVPLSLPKEAALTGGRG